MPYPFRRRGRGGGSVRAQPLVGAEGSGVAGVLLAAIRQGLGKVRMKRALVIAGVGMGLSGCIHVGPFGHAENEGGRWASPMEVLAQREQADQARLAAQAEAPAAVPAVTGVAVEAAPMAVASAGLAPVAAPPPPEGASASAPAPVEAAPAPEPVPAQAAAAAAIPSEATPPVAAVAEAPAAPAPQPA